ncbi:MAG: hypothetical protein DRQ62_09610, partial [Gammaproteobacteria bacterium]
PSEKIDSLTPVFEIDSTASILSGNTTLTNTRVGNATVKLRSGEVLDILDNEIRINNAIARVDHSNETIYNAGVQGIEYIVDADSAIVHEHAATNVITDSLYDSGTWTSQGSPAITENNSIAPDGTTTGFNLVVANTSTWVEGPLTTPDDFVEHILVGRIKLNASSNKPRMMLSVDGNSIGIEYLASNGTVSKIENGTGVVTGFGAIEDINGWITLWVTGTGWAAAAVPYYGTGNAGGDDYDAWHIELVEGNVLSSLIKSSGGVGTRNIDDLRLSTTNPAEGVYVMSYRPLHLPGVHHDALNKSILSEASGPDLIFDNKLVDYNFTSSSGVQSHTTIDGWDINELITIALYFKDSETILGIKKGLSTSFSWGVVASYGGGFGVGALRLFSAAKASFSLNGLSLLDAPAGKTLAEVKSMIENDTGKINVFDNPSIGESRAVFSTGMQHTTKAGADLLISDLIEMGATTLICSVINGKGVSYPSILETETDSRWTYDATFPDPLAYIINKCKENNIAFYAHVNCNLRSSGTWRTEFFDADTPANSFDIHLQAYRDYFTSLVVEIVTKYAVDGVNLDTIRSKGTSTAAQWITDYATMFPGESLVTDKAAVVALTPHPTSVSEQEPYDRIEAWHESAVTDLVTKISTQTRAINSSIILSCDATPSSLFKTAEGRDDVNWVNNGLLDICYNMYYKDVDAHRADQIVNACSKFDNPEKCVTIISTYDTGDMNVVYTAAQLDTNIEIIYAGSTKRTGFALFGYGTTFDLIPLEQRQMLKINHWY